MTLMVSALTFSSANAAEQVLSPREEQVARISACTAASNMTTLREVLESALDAGMSIAEAKDLFTQLYAYCGFPKALNALGVLRELAEARAAAGKQDRPGEDNPSPLLPDALERGTATQTQLCGAPVKGALFDFAPAIDAYLKAHLFGDVFGSSVHDWRTREIATIAALSVMPGTEPQCRAHIGIGRHNGLSAEQVEAVLQTAAAVAPKGDIFPSGEPADASVFTGSARVSMLTDRGSYDTAVYNVTFAPGTRNNWHRHTKGQILLCTVGEGLYQERGKTARRLRPGDVVQIPADTDHWHGATADSVFVHIGITPEASSNQTTWQEAVSDEDYAAADSTTKGARP
ncbi:MAG: carboxymuconolactone decarboxylase family protein [Akkermansia sp.]